MKKKSLVYVLLLSFGFIMLSCGEKQESILVDSERMDIQANILFFYYENLDAVQQFYEDIIGLEIILDYGFAKVFRVSQTLFLGIVDEQKGMHRADEPKTVTLSFVTDEIDEWYDYLSSQGVDMRGPVNDASRHPTRGFVAYDPEGYYLEFERFLDHPQNEILLQKISQTNAVYPMEEQKTSRPDNLGIMGNIVWLYYKNLENAQLFYRDVFGFDLLVDQGFAKVYSCSPTAFIGLVDEALGLHNFSEEKSVTFSFISEQIEDWYKHMIKKDLEIREPLSQSETIPVKAFVTYDVAGYFLEFDWFPEHEKNTKLLSLLK